MARRKRQHTQSSPQARAPESPEKAPRSPWPARLLYGAGCLYILDALLLLAGSAGKDSAIGALCQTDCGGVALFDIPVEIYGIALMGAVLALAWKAARAAPSPWPFAALSAALLHAGGSAAFAASQLLGLAAPCPLCLLASLFSFAVAGAAWRLYAVHAPFFLLSAAQSALIGALAVGVAWPRFEGLKPPGNETATAVQEETAPESGAQFPQDPLVRQALSLATIGSPEAPYELVVLSDMNCGVCERFEQRTLPDLLPAIEEGRIRVRFLFTTMAVTEQRARHQLVAATGMAAAGEPFPEAVGLVRNEPLVSTPQGIALLEDNAERSEAMRFIYEVSQESSWDAVEQAHHRLSWLLRNRYFNGEDATPLFVMFPGSFDPQNVRPKEELYIFKGYQKAGPFLQFAGWDHP